MDVSCAICCETLFYICHVPYNVTLAMDVCHVPYSVSVAVYVFNVPYNV